MTRLFDHEGEHEKPMAENKTGFQEYLKKELENTRGIFVPVKAGFLRRLLVRRIACKKLHPNPEDEFCSPTVGPNSKIISKYSQDFRRFGTHSSVEYVIEPLTVEKIRPGGYLILNGHHRWAAAIMTGQRSLPVQIVDLPMEEDIRRMLRQSRNDRRVTLDLDEVVFRNEGDGPVEKLPFSCACATSSASGSAFPRCSVFSTTRATTSGFTPRNTIRLSRSRRCLCCIKPA